MSDFISKEKALNIDLSFEVDIPPHKKRTIKAAEDAAKSAVAAYAEYIGSIPAADVIPIDFIENQMRICEAIPAPFCSSVLRQLIQNYRDSLEGRE